MQHVNPFRTGPRLTLVMLLAVAGAAWLAPAAFAAADDSVVSVRIPVGSYDITSTQDGDTIALDGFGRSLVPGKPKLPSRIFAVAIPPGADVIDVTYDAGEGVVLSGMYQIPPAALPRVIGEENPVLYAKDKARYEENFASVYTTDTPYPQEVVTFVRPAQYRKYNLADVRVMPFTYRPVSGQLTYYPDITVHVRYRFPENPPPPVADNLARTEAIAKDIVLNYDQAQTWHPRDRSGGRGLHDFVIITLDSLTSSVTPLVDRETTKGRTVEVVTTSWIDSTYTGYDLAEQMRNFLRDKYPSNRWGIEDVLLVGDYDAVPMRRTAQNLGYGRPETDLYYADLSLPDSESWDADGDHQYGEESDPIDFYSEVNVGRIPWSNPATVQSICEKSIAYEQNDDPAFKKNILLLGGYFWANTDNAVLMEAKVSTPWMSDWTMTRMYEKNSGYWSSYDCDYPLLHSNVMDVWPAGQYSFVNWAGHGSPTSCHIYGLGAPAFIQSSDCPSLNDDYPAIIFADACSNSDTDHLNIGQAMLEHGAVGFVGATKVAYGCPGWSEPLDGSSQSLDFFFTIYVTSGNYTQGAALQAALRQMYLADLWMSEKYETFEWAALWGNPSLIMFLPAETCNDGLLNQGEQRIDCGGPCPSCDCLSDEACDDFEFCTGVETCSAFGSCYASGDPCVGTDWPFCDEANGECDECIVDDQCADEDECTVDACDAPGVCVNEYDVRLHGDVYPAPNGDDAVEGFDILCVLDRANDLPRPDCMSCDIYPCDSGDGAVEGADILAVLDAAALMPWCEDPCP